MVEKMGKMVTLGDKELVGERYKKTFWDDRNILYLS